MRMEQSFTVSLPPEQAWSVLIDIERVAPCLPGAEVTGTDDDGDTYRGLFTVKIGPAPAKARGELKLEIVDETGHSAIIHAQGSDTRGQGGARAQIDSKVVPDGHGARVHVATDLTITGKLARFGRGGMIEGVSRELLERFAACLEKKCGEPMMLTEVTLPSPAAPADSLGSAQPPSAPVEQHAEPLRAIPLMMRALWRRFVRLFRRG